MWCRAVDTGKARVAVRKDAIGDEVTTRADARTPVLEGEQVAGSSRVLHSCLTDRSGPVSSDFTRAVSVAHGGETIVAVNIVSASLVPKAARRGVSR